MRASQVMGGFCRFALRMRTIRSQEGQSPYVLKGNLLFHLLRIPRVETAVVRLTWLMASSKVGHMKTQTKTTRFVLAASLALIVVAGGLWKFNASKSSDANKSSALITVTSPAEASSAKKNAEAARIANANLTHTAGPIITEASGLNTASATEVAAYQRNLESRVRSER